VLVPLWFAVMEHVPTETILNVNPETVHTASEFDVSTTVPPGAEIPFSCTVR
jgi:hypothetical protein